VSRSLKLHSGSSSRFNSAEALPAGDDRFDQILRRQICEKQITVQGYGGGSQTIY
jgi:hypothetical protein